MLTITITMMTKYYTLEAAGKTLDAMNEFATEAEADEFSIATIADGTGFYIVDIEDPEEIYTL